MIGQIGAIAGLGSSDLGLKNPADLFVAMLTSRTIEDNLINRFDLRKVYRAKTYQDARKKLDKRSEILATKEGLISVSVTDNDPKRAAEIANAYVEELHNLNQNLAITEASQRRLFYEQQIKAEQKELSAAELALKQAQEKSGLLQPDAQGRAIIAGIADLRAQVASHEVQLQTMRSYATPNNPDLKRAETELAGLRGQLAKLEHSDAAVGNGNIDDSRPGRCRKPNWNIFAGHVKSNTTKRSTTSWVNNWKRPALMRVKMQFSSRWLTGQSNQKRSRAPSGMLLVLISTTIAFVLACLGVLIVEALRRKRQDPNQGARLGLLRRSLKFSSWS